MTTRDIHANEVDEPAGRTTGQDSCPECDGPIREADGETTCADCGLVLAENRIDRGPEWRSFDITTRKRTGEPLTATRHDRGLSTDIGYVAELPGEKRRRFARLRRRNKRAKFDSKAERNLARAFTEIARMTSALELPYSIRERACEIYREAQRENLIQGRSMEALAAGSVYSAIRCNGTTRTLEEVASVARRPREKVKLGYDVLNRELGLAAKVTRPAEYVPRIASAADAPDRVRHRALTLAEQAEAQGLTSGSHPGGVAAACVYLAGHEAGQLYTQIELASVVDVTPTTLRKHFRRIRKQLA